MMGAPGGVRLGAFLGDYNKRRDDVFFEQRAFSGYVDFLVSNNIGDPNLAVISYLDDPKFVADEKKLGLIESSYVFNLSQDYILPQAVGFLLGGAVPSVMEVGAFKERGYAALFEADKMGGKYKGTFWIDAFKDYARFTKELVLARKNYRRYFHGIWHKGVSTNSSFFHRYYFSDKKDGIKKSEWPKVLSVVRQPFGARGPENSFGIFLLNTYILEPSQTINFTFKFSDYGLTSGKRYALFERSPTGRKPLGFVYSDFSRVVKIPAGKLAVFELVY